eukprot:778609_1
MAAVPFYQMFFLILFIVIILNLFFVLVLLFFVFYLVLLVVWVFFFLSCGDADTFYQHEAETSDLEQLASWLSPQCCSTKSDIQKYWWDALQDHRKGVHHGKIGIIIKGVMGMISVISSSTFIWMLRR